MRPSSRPPVYAQRASVGVRLPSRFPSQVLIIAFPSRLCRSPLPALCVEPACICRFAAEKGIKKRTKRNKVWDEGLKQWVLRWRKPRKGDIVEDEDGRQKEAVPEEPETETSTGPPPRHTPTHPSFPCTHTRALPHSHTLSCSSLPRLALTPISAFC